MLNTPESRLSISKAALYPFNKITQGLIRFRDLLDFEIQNVIDFSISVGDDAGTIVTGKQSGIMISDSVEASLADVDTLILNDPGTVFAGNEATFEKFDLINKWRAMVLKANQMGVQVVSVHEIFDTDTLKWINESHAKIIIGKQMNENLLKALDVFDVPSRSYYDRVYEYINSFDTEKTLFTQTKIKKIAILSTRGCLGKYTTQMSLYRELTKRGKKVLPLITEPTAFLYKRDDADLPKFLAERSLQKYPYYINELVKKADKEQYEYVIFSGQGSIAPYKALWLDAMKLNLLQAFDADTTLLVAGYHDNDEIDASIQILRIYGGHQPSAILIPDKVETHYGSYEMKTAEQISKRKEELKQLFHIPNVELIHDITRITDIVL